MRLLKSLLLGLICASCISGIAVAQLEDFDENEGFISQMSKSFVSLEAPSLDAIDMETAFDDWQGTLPPSLDNSHPLYRTMDTGDPGRVIAHSRYGNVTSRDLYLWLTISNSSVPADVLYQYDKLKTTREKEQLAPLIEKSIKNYLWINHIVPGMKRTINNPAEDALIALRSHVYSLPGWQLVYMLRSIKPSIKVTEADRLHALQQNVSILTSGESWQVRYIFMASNRNDDLTSQSEVRAAMDRLRDDLVSGTLTFADAARQYSQAPSAARGGVIPPFFRGQYFFAFENAASQLQPGGLSDVFDGPSGLYMVQLMRSIPPREASMSDAETAAKVENIVMTNAIRSAFRERVRLLNEKSPIGNMWSHWDTTDADDVIAYVTGVELTKRQVEQLLPVEDARSLELRDKMLKNFLESYLEGENIVKDVKKLGLECDGDLEKMKRMAHNLALRDALQDEIACSLDSSESTVRSFYNSHPELFRPLPLKRLVRLTLTPVNLAPTTTATLQEMYRIIEGRPRDPEAVINLPVWDAEFVELDGGNALVPKVEDSKTSLPVPAKTEPAPAIKETPVKTNAATTDTQAASTETSVSSESHTESVETTAATQSDAVATSASSAVRVDVPETASSVGVTGGADSAPRAVGCPPAVSRKKIAPTVLRSLVSQYKSSDWFLRYDDYGYVYLEDLPNLPKTVAKLKVGDYSEPIFIGLSAVSYYLEDERNWPMQNFDSVKAYAYEIYRRAQIDMRLYRAKKSGLDKAGLSFSY